MKRMAEHARAAYQRGWWLTVSPDIRARVASDYADYYTPEQRADLAEFGACYFEDAEGHLYHMQVGHWPLPEPRPDYAVCLNTSSALPYGAQLVAFKLLYQANAAGARAIAGRDGARLPA